MLSQLVTQYSKSSVRGVIKRLGEPYPSGTSAGILGGSSPRSFHATQRQEILPLIAVGTLLVVGRYSWKALNRMDEEWEDYQWRLEQYERQRMKESADNLPITVGVDFGSLYLKLSHAQPKAELVPTAEGDRYRFNGMYLPEDGSEDMIMGRSAYDKFFYKPAESNATETVLLPFAELQKANDNNVARMVQTVFVPAVGEAMERISQREDSQVRTILTLPPVFYNTHHSTIFENYEDHKHNTICLPDPVAGEYLPYHTYICTLLYMHKLRSHDSLFTLLTLAIWGAQNLDLLPTRSSKDEKNVVVVIDVGALVTTLSIVENDIVVSSISMDKVGGETFVERLVDRIVKEASEVSPSLADDPMSLMLIHQQARQSVMELVNQTSTKVHIPFLFMGRRQDDPHFNAQISRTALEQSAQDYWKEEIVPQLESQPEPALSASMPRATNLSGIVSSGLTQLLENSGHSPMSVNSILLIGGGARHPSVEQHCKRGVELLMGPDASSKMVVPRSDLRQDLTALGAVSLLPNFTYSYDYGLQRDEN